MATKRMMAACMVIGVMVMSVLSGMGMMGAEGEDGNFGGGDGTAGDPYVIEDAWDLQAIAGDLAAHYILGNDIDASMTAEWDSGAGFEPVGTTSDPFMGSLDGDGHAISGLVIDRPDMYVVGLFGCIGEGASVTGVGLEGGYVAGYFCVGGLVGWSYGTVEGSYSTAGVSGEEPVGGLVGWNELGTISASYSTGDVTASGWGCFGGLVGLDNQGIVSDCHAEGDVSGFAYTGGLIGYSFFSIISDCSATGDVTGYYYIGGLVGFCDYGSEVYGSYATGAVGGGECVGGLLGFAEFNTVSECYATGDVAGDYAVGGFTSVNDFGPLTGCYATGDVIGGDVAGGFVGMNLGPISDCYATGAVVGNTYVGGFMGWQYYNDVSDCYSAGTVDGTDGVGGLVGWFDDGTVSDCFWDVDASGQDMSAGGTGVTTGEMMTASTFTDAGWDLTGTWFMFEAVTYPLLRWQDAGPPEANAGADQTEFKGAWVTFDGTGSTDDYGIVDHTWTFTDGELVTLDGAEVAYQFNNPGIFVVTLEVTDGVGNSDTDTCTITVLNNPPVAVAGDDLILIVGEEGTLDASGSYDVDGTLSNYDWDWGDGTAHGTGTNPTHAYASSGTYTVTLTVTDDDGDTGTDTLTVTVLTPVQAIDSLIDITEAMDLHGGTENSLISKLENAQKSLEKGNDDAAINKLEAFINEVEAHRGKKITEEQADTLVGYAQWIIDNI